MVNALDENLGWSKMKILILVVRIHPKASFYGNLALGKDEGTTSPA